MSKSNTIDTQSLGREKMRVMLVNTILLLFSSGISHGLRSKHIIKDCIKMHETERAFLSLCINI